MKRHTLTVLRFSDLSVRTFKVVYYRANQRTFWGVDEWGTRYSWPASEFSVHQS